MNHSLKSLSRLGCTAISSQCSGLSRPFHSSCPLERRTKISYYQKYRWLRLVQIHKQRAKHPWIPRENPTGLQIKDHWVEFPEMVPEFIVPDLTDFSLKPYVEWNAEMVYTPEMTSKRLFDATYGEKVRELISDAKEPLSAEKIDLNEIKKQL